MVVQDWERPQKEKSIGTKVTENPKNGENTAAGLKN